MIDKMAKQGDRSAHTFPGPCGTAWSSASAPQDGTPELVKQKGMPAAGEMPGVVASFQEAVVDVLVEKTLRAAGENGLKQVVVCGGVAANSRLRTRFQEDARERGIEVLIPPPILCTDNAAMIAVVGDYRLSRGLRDSYDLNAVSRWPLSERQ